MAKILSIAAATTGPKVTTSLPDTKRPGPYTCTISCIIMSEGRDVGFQSLRESGVAGKLSTCITIMCNFHVKLHWACGQWQDC